MPGLRIHRQWFLLGAGSLAALVAGSAWGVSAIESASKDSAYLLSSRCFQRNALFRQQLGVITGAGAAVTGPVVKNTDGSGWAIIQFDVDGSWRTGREHVHLVRIDGTWWIESGLLAVGGQEFPYRPARTIGSPAQRARCELTSSTTRSHAS